MIDAPTIGSRVATVTRVLDAPRELVWKAWTKLEGYSVVFDRVEAHRHSCSRPAPDRGARSEGPGPGPSLHSRDASA